LHSKKEILYDDGDVNKKIETESLYYYENPDHNQITRTQAIDSRGKTTKQILQYAEDLAGNELGSDLLKEAHIHSQVLRQTTFIDEAPVAKTEIQYDDKNGNLVPAFVVEYANGIDEASKVANEYDAYGNVVNTVEVIEEDANGVMIVPGANKSYVWGYGHSFPIAQIENARHTDVFHTSFEDDEGNSEDYDSKAGRKSRTGGYNKPLANLTNGAFLLTYWAKTVNGWVLETDNVTVTTGTYTINIDAEKQVDDIRFCPAAARMTTCTYDPFVGITSVTDNNNIITHYEYDNLGRLKLVKDKDQKIIRNFYYHYKQ
jgi:YD repeat-containing protein